VEEAEVLARAYTKDVFYGGGAWRAVRLDAPGFGRLIVAPPGALSLEDAMEFQTYQQERVARAGPTLFVTRDTDFPEGVHPAHVVRTLDVLEETGAEGAAGVGTSTRRASR
jgi:hypothetical protein